MWSIKSTHNKPTINLSSTIISTLFKKSILFLSPKFTSVTNKCSLQSKKILCPLFFNFLTLLKKPYLKKMLIKPLKLSIPYLLSSWTNSQPNMVSKYWPSKIWNSSSQVLRKFSLLLIDTNPWDLCFLQIAEQFIVKIFLFICLFWL